MVHGAIFAAEGGEKAGCGVGGAEAVDQVSGVTGGAGVGVGEQRVEMGSEGVQKGAVVGIDEDGDGSAADGFVGVVEAGSRLSTRRGASVSGSIVRAATAARPGLRRFHQWCGARTVSRASRLSAMWRPRAAMAATRAIGSLCEAASMSGLTAAGPMRPRARALSGADPFGRVVELRDEVGDGGRSEWTDAAEGHGRLGADILFLFFEKSAKDARPRARRSPQGP